MEIQRIVSSMLQSNMYLIKDGNDVLIVDPSVCIELSFPINTLTILLTHEHYDHICATNYWKRKYRGIVMCSRECAENIKNPRRNCARYFDAFVQMQSWIVAPETNNIDENFSCEADRVLNDGEIIEWHHHTIKSLFMPGHSQGGMGYLMDDALFFSGDNILPGCATELRLPGGCKKDWYSITKPILDKLDNNTSIFPGHFIPLSVGEWRDSN